jgi:hypothetical protein
LVLLPRWWWYVGAEQQLHNGGQRNSKNRCNNNPHQAAFYRHMDASARQEQERVTCAMQKLMTAN